MIIISTQVELRRIDTITVNPTATLNSFWGYQGERNLTGWPHTICQANQEPEALPQVNTPHAL
jgi:hypothetical protein